MLAIKKSSFYYLWVLRIKNKRKEKSRKKELICHLPRKNWLSSVGRGGSVGHNAVGYSLRSKPFGTRREQMKKWRKQNNVIRCMWWHCSTRCNALSIPRPHTLSSNHHQCIRIISFPNKKYKNEVLTKKKTNYFLSTHTRAREQRKKWCTLVWMKYVPNAAWIGIVFCKLFFLPQKLSECLANFPFLMPFFESLFAGVSGEKKNDHNVKLS